MLLIAVYAAATLITVPATADAAPEGNDPNKWRFEFTPYFFAAGMNGKTGMNRVTADVDVGFDKILENLDSGFMAIFEARKGPWSFVFEGVYFKLKDEKADSWQGPLGNSNTGTLEATVTEQLYQLSVGYRVSDDRVKVDVIGAARMTMLDTSLDLTMTTGSPLLPDGSRSVSMSQSWVDPVIGMRVLVPLAEKWTAVGLADIGGFGIGSDITYQLLAGVNWQFSKIVSAKVGYRYLYQDYENNGFIWDMTAQGFYVGAGFRF
ncbi:MAG: hypothetical protein ACM33C_03240 [Syntrophaceae bacterium]